ncbi:MAG: DUF3237 domain-containing protein [Parafilimonas terrae]|nr:DUF3237 domain-containing protein [Parafilimonas terrae]
MNDHTLTLTHAFTCRVTCGEVFEIGAGPLGERRCYTMTGGCIEGDRLSGDLVGPGSDWMITEPDGLMRMDVRLLLRTDDGALVALRYFGPAQSSDAMRRALAANEPTGFADQAIRTHWLLETGDPRHAWVNRTVFVGEGRVRPAGPGTMGFEHKVYRVG